MSLLPLIALKKASPTATGVYRVPALDSDTPPDDWLPDPKTSRPASVPSPWAREEVASYLLRRGVPHPIVDEGCVSLLYGLIGGVFQFRWVAVKSLKALPLQKALLVYSKDHVPAENVRVGLITQETAPGDRTVWGFIGDEGIAVPAGHAAGSAAGLSALKSAAFSQRRHREVSEILRRLKETLNAAGKWDAKLPWMALVERTIEACHVEGAQPDRSASAVNFGEDVRSFGPFAWRLPDGAREEGYLLAYDHEFVKRLDRAFSYSAVHPGQLNSERDVTILRQGPTDLARFRHRTGQQAELLSLGEGLVDWLAPSVPPGVSALDGKTPELLQPRTPETSFTLRDHIDVMRQRVGGNLSAAVTESPFRLTDVARAVGKFRPELIGEQAALKGSTNFDAVAKKLAGRLTEDQVNRLVADGNAVRLAPSGGARGADVVYLEILPQGDGGVVHVGDLSDLGAALWQVFRAEEGWLAAGQTIQFADAEVFDQPFEFPVVIDSKAKPIREAHAAFRDAQGLSSNAATLQRFLRSYALPSDDDPPAVANGARLAAVAARAFAKRWLGADRCTALEAICAQRLPEVKQLDQVKLEARPERLGQSLLIDYGLLPVLGDPLRQE